MIRLVNKNEYMYCWQKQPVIAASNPTAVTNGLASYAPTASKICDVFGMPFDGNVVGLVLVVNTVGTAGNSTDLKCAYRMRNGGYDLAGTTVLTEDAVAMDISLTPDLIPVAGTRIVVGALANQAPIPLGSLVHLHYNESGTAGTATRPIVNPVGVILRALGNIDPRDIGSKH